VKPLLENSETSKMYDESINQPWKLDSWRNFHAAQQPVWGNLSHHSQAVNRLASLPGLTSAREIDNLRSALCDAAAGKAFIVQFGDCAEEFNACTSETLDRFYDLSVSIADVIESELGRQPVIIGRIAGQYAKPRSKAHETIADVLLPVYRGDLINSPDRSEEARKHDPQRLISGYMYSAATLNYLRVKQNIYNLPIYTSHEALVLEYEESLTRLDPYWGKWYDLSAHLLWIGDRTRFHSGAHIEFARGLGNPVALKIGPDYHMDDVKKAIYKLNPDNHIGKIVIISRMGHKWIMEKLPPLIEMVKEEGFLVNWFCDPMHGNTINFASNFKIRTLADIISETVLTIQIHKQESTLLSGVHLEMTGEPVIECVPLITKSKCETLDDHYKSVCDPRLNGQQGIAYIHRLAQYLKKNEVKSIDE
jgi:3-deoxy-7-phosphoheptulonate synthase